MSHCTDEAASHPELQKPLSCTWREWIALQEPEPEADVVVVGSGYGGSVAALRLAQKGHQVLLLERGSEYLPGDFPNDFSGVPKHFRLNIPGRGVPLGRASGLVEVSVGQGMVAVTGNGVGGGSLINAGVLLRPDADVFAQDVWPADIRHGFGSSTGESELDQAFSRAEAELGGRLFEPPAQGRSLCKTEALYRVAEAARPNDAESRFKPAMLTINPARCTSCGDCASGCNVPGAKRTLGRSYLRKAVKTGRVQIVSQAQVYRFEPCTPRAGGTAQWRITVFGTDTQHQVLSVREASTPRPSKGPQDGASTVRKIRATTLVISAGALGSTQLLQRSQALAGEALAFSQSLGTRLSGNGDSVSVNTGESRRVNAVGFGADAGLRSMDHTDPQKREDVVGPTITATLDLRDPGKPLDQRLLVQDGAIPGALARPFAELIATAYSVGQLGSWWFRNPQPPCTHGTDPLAATDAMARHSQVLLAMGHDGSPGRMVWLPGMDTSAPVYGQADQLRTYQEQQRLFDRMKDLGTHVHSPLWQGLPESMGRFFKGVKPPSTVTTVHPLGGCPMGDDPTTSVVNHLGQVWVYEPADTGRTGTRPGAQQQARPPNSPQVYPGLFVLDGSIVPSSLGCNPMLTITALAERSMAKWPRRIPARTPAQPLRSQPRPKASFVREPFASDVQLSETLRATGASLRGLWFERTDRLRLHLVLKARLDADDFDRTLRRHDHPMKIGHATLELIRTPDVPREMPLKDRAPAELVATYTAIPGGSFEFLRANCLSSGMGLTFWCSLQLFAWVSLAALVLLNLLQPALPLLGWNESWLAWPGTWSTSVLAGLLLVVCTLPYPRTVLTWMVMRGWSDIAHREVRHEPFLRSSWRTLQWIHALLKQLMHAAETRDMRYSFTLKRTAASSPCTDDEFPGELLFKANKRVAYRASLAEWGVWLARHTRRLFWRFFLGPGFPLRKLPEIPPLRPGLWEQVMNAHVEVCKAGPYQGIDLARGVMAMSLDSLFNRDSAQLGQRGDTTSGLLLLAGYPLLLARFAIKTRLFDFRLPNHTNLPVVDSAQLHDVKIRQSNGRFLAPELHWLPVERGQSSSDQGTERVDDLHLRLWRYRCANHIPAVQNGEWMGIRVCRARSVLLLHAFGQSGLSYTHQAEGSRPGSNLAEAFHAAGYEVWILDSRMSTRSGHAAQPVTVDMQARHDVPAAVNKILELIKADLPNTCKDPLQISAFGQCIGAASLWMAMLDGHLSYRLPAAAVLGNSERPPMLSKIACVAFSQVHALTQGSPGTRAKTWLPGLLQAIAPAGVIPFAVRGAQDSLVLNFLDRLLSTLPAPEAERTHSRNEDGVATCKRIRFVEAPLFEHENMHPSTIAQMNRLFGDSSIRLFAQARRFVERGRLVDEDGVNRYVTDDNIRNHLALPVQLLHGVKNRLFDVQSAHDTHDLLDKLGCSWMPAGVQRPQLSHKHGHLDVLLGTNAAKDVFEGLLKFFDKSQTLAVQAPPPDDKLWVIRAPRVGPWVGRVVRTGQRALVRVVFMVDDLHGGQTAPGQKTLIIVRRLDPALGLYRPIHINDLGLFDVPADPGPGTPSPSAYRTAWVDVPVDWPVNARQPLDFQVMTAHQVDRLRDPSVLPAGALQPLTTFGQPVPQPPLLSMPYRTTRVNRTPFTLLLPARLTLNPDDSPTLDKLLADDEKTSLRYHLESSLTGMPVEPSMLSRVHFSVPLASLEAVDPRSKGLSFFAACCRHPGLDLDARRIDHVLRARDRMAPAFALLVGDQIYADATAGLIDPLSPTERFVERYETAFGPQGMGRFLSRTPTYMTPDDHEWTDAHPNGSPLLKWSWGQWAKGKRFRKAEGLIHERAGQALTAFERSLTWPLPRPNGTVRRQGWTRHSQGCVELWIIDSRSWRNRRAQSGHNAKVMADKHFRRLLHELSRADTDVLHVIVTGSVVLPGLHANADPANPGAIDTWQYAPDQRNLLLETLVSHRERRFLLVSGDYHVSTAVSLSLDGRTVGASIVAPPIYAPLPYANAAPEHVFIDECVALPSGSLTQHSCPGSEAVRGNGLGEVTVERQGTGYRISYSRRLTVLETGETVVRKCEFTL